MPRYDPSYPSTLAIYCSDGRFTHAIEHHCEDLGHERIDTMTLPGGPALLISGAADLSEVHVFSRAAHASLRRHFPQLTVACFYAAPDGDGAAVTFTDVTPAA